MLSLCSSAALLQIPVLCAGGFVERNGFNCVEGFWKRLQATQFYEADWSCQVVNV